MYEPTDPAAEEGARKFRQLIIDRTGYPRRGSLADLERLTKIPGPMLGRYARGESIPGDKKLRVLAPALGTTYQHLHAMLHAVSGDAAVPEPEPDGIHRLTELLSEAQQIINSFRVKAVEASRASESTRRRKRTRMDYNHPNEDYGNQPAFGKYSTVVPTIA